MDFQANYSHCGLMIMTVWRVVANMNLVWPRTILIHIFETPKKCEPPHEWLRIDDVLLLLASHPPTLVDAEKLSKVSSVLFCGHRSSFFVTKAKLSVSIFHYSYKIIYLQFIWGVCLAEVRKYEWFNVVCRAAYLHIYWHGSMPPTF